jgi:peptide deformylase
MKEMEIKIYGHPVLRDTAKNVEKLDAETLQELEGMLKAMYDANGVGIAAPQVGISKRMFIVDIGDGVVRYVINPEFLEMSKETMDDEEGCLSVPGIHKNVKRAAKVKIKYMNEKGEEIVEEATELLSRAFQHEYDHLDGILFVDKISPVAKRMVSKKLQLLKKESEKNNG